MGDFVYMLIRGRLCKPRARGYTYILYTLCEVPPTEVENRLSRSNPRQVKRRSRGVIMLSEYAGDGMIPVNDIRCDVQACSVRSEDRTGGKKRSK